MHPSNMTIPGGNQFFTAAMKDGRTVRSEFANYVSRIFNRSVPAHRTPFQFLKRTVPSINLVKQRPVNDIDNRTYVDVFFVYIRFVFYRKIRYSVADLGGGDGGDASPPTSLKVTILAEKSASILNNSAPFWDASPPPT